MIQQLVLSHELQLQMTGWLDYVVSPVRGLHRLAFGSALTVVDPNVIVKLAPVNKT